MRWSGKLLVALLSGLALAQSGCTVALWKDTGHWNAFETPANPNHMQVFHDPHAKDYLVVFDQLSERSDRIVTRAYYLNANESRTERREHPSFVSLRRAESLARVPVVTPGETLPDRRPFVVASADDYKFQIYPPEDDATSHFLPVYSDQIGQMERVILTPVAIVVDATIFGALIFVESAAQGN